jgi:methionyl-tRNA formyltransferase
MGTRKQQNLRVLFWGMSGQFSALVYDGLQNAGIDLCGLVVPGPNSSSDKPPIIRLDPDPLRSQLPISQPYLQRSITHLAWQNQVPVYELRRLSSADAAAQLAALEADLAIVACFPRLVPENILAIPTHGFLNLHPSLLPELRGPYPLFHTFRLGQQRTGITVHNMDAGLDTGDIALQQEIILPDGISGPQADALLATHGASLLLDACRRLAAGTLPRTPQLGAGSTYARPSAEDFHILTSWPARRAYNFIRGTAEWGTPYRVSGQGIDLSLREVLSFDASAFQQQPLLQDGREHWIQFTPGVLHAC